MEILINLTCVHRNNVMMVTNKTNNFLLQILIIFITNWLLVTCCDIVKRMTHNARISRFALILVVDISRG